jgi:hypothetical protein
MERKNPYKKKSSKPVIDPASDPLADSRTAEDFVRQACLMMLDPDVKMVDATKVKIKGEAKNYVPFRLKAARELAKHSGEDVDDAEGDNKDRQ